MQRGVEPARNKCKRMRLLPTAHPPSFNHGAATLTGEGDVSGQAARCRAHRAEGILLWHKFEGDSKQAWLSPFLKFS